MLFERPRPENDASHDPRTTNQALVRPLGNPFPVNSAVRFAVHIRACRELGIAAGAGVFEVGLAIATRGLISGARCCTRAARDTKLRGHSKFNTASALIGQLTKKTLSNRIGPV